MAKQDKSKAQRYASLMDKHYVQKKPLTEEELTFIKGYTPEIDDVALADINEAANNLKLPNEVRQKALQSMTLLAYKGNESELIDVQEKLAKGKVAENVRNALNLALGAADIATSVKQTREGERAARRSRRPQQPAALKADPLLAQAIEEARVGTFDTARRLAPAQQAILDNYLSDLNIARTASTGQAGTYGALGQVAANRRGRASMQLGTMADDISAREQGRLDSLIGLKQQENQAIQQSQAQFYPTELDQYQREQLAAGQLQSTGRQNLRNSLLNLGQQVPDLAAQLATKRRFDRLRMTDETFGTGGLAERADIIANQRANGTFNYAELPDFISPELNAAYGFTPRRRY